MKINESLIKQIFYGLFLLACMFCTVMLLYMGQYLGAVCFFVVDVIVFSLLTDYIKLLEYESQKETVEPCVGGDTSRG